MCLWVREAKVRGHTSLNYGNSFRVEECPLLIGGHTSLE